MISPSYYHFPRSHRLLTKKDYQQVFARPVRSSDHCFTILCCKNDLPYARLGLAIAKKTIAKAHQRNRIKRLVRESFRLYQPFNTGMDMVVLAKKGLQEQSNSEIQTSLVQHWNRLSKRCAES